MKKFCFLTLILITTISTTMYGEKLDTPSAPTIGVEDVSTAEELAADRLLFQDGNGIIAAAVAATAKGVTRVAGGVDDLMSVNQIKYRKLIISQLNKNQDKACRIARDFINRGLRREDLVFFIRMENKFPKSSAIKKIKKQIFALKYPGEHFVVDGLKQIGEKGETPLALTSIEWLIDRGNKQEACDVIVELIYRGNLSAKLIEALERIDDKNCLEKTKSIPYEEFQRLAPEVKVFKILVTGAFEKSELYIDPIFEECESVLEKCDLDYFKKCLRLLERNIKADPGCLEVNLLRRLLKNVNGDKASLIRQVLSVNNIDENPMRLRWKYPPDNLEGFFYSQEVDENGRWKLVEKRPSPFVGLEKFAKMPDEQLKARWRDPDYTIRLFIYTKVLQTPYEKEYPLYYSGDRGWEPYVVKLMVDLKHASERENTNPNFDMHAGLLRIVLGKLHPVSIPALLAKAKEEKISIDYRKAIVNTLADIPGRFPSAQQEVLKCLNEIAEKRPEVANDARAGIEKISKD